MSMTNALDGNRAFGPEHTGLTSWRRGRLFALICLHIGVCCASLVMTASFQAYMLYDADRLGYALVAALAFSIISLLFVFARFSFGYFIGF
jgi:hypothetical protein